MGDDRAVDDGTIGARGNAASAEADWLATNRANWDARTRVHADSDFYDLPGFLAGGSTLRPFELAEVGAVSGRRLLHLQCHMGQDTLSWARLGADVTGLDFSPEAVRTARALAADTRLDGAARFVVADVYDAPAAVADRRFDIVYTGLGALVWLPDLTRWARVVASLLADGGFLYLAEFHPVADVLDDVDGARVVHDYFQTQSGTWDSDRTYTDGPALAHTLSVQWHHPLGDVVTAIARAGLRVEFLHEHPTELSPRFPVLERDASGAYTFPPGHPRIPLMYSLRASNA